MHGAWNPHPGSALPLHMSPIKTRRQERNAARVHVVSHSARRSGQIPGPVAPLELAVKDAVSCLQPAVSHVVLESLLTRKLITPSALKAILGGLAPETVRRIGPITALSGSGSESLVARWLWARGTGFTQQAFISGVGYVDFLVGLSLIIEIDSAEFHGSPSDVMHDRRRDFAARAQGYTVVRLSWEQVHREWLPVTTQLAALLKNRVHLRPLSPLA